MKEVTSILTVQSQIEDQLKSFQSSKEQLVSTSEQLKRVLDKTREENEELQRMNNDSEKVLERFLGKLKNIQGMIEKRIQR